MSGKVYSLINKTANKLSLGQKIRNRRKIIEKFANQVGLVYFGFVDQNKDEHKVVRGLTVSSVHKDNHYCVGSVDGYNVAIVDRTDYIWQPDGTKALHNWIILTFDLNSKRPIPHFFIGARNRDLKPFSSLFSSFPNMHKVDLGTFETYDIDFTSRFSIYARTAKFIDIEKIIPSKTARVLGAHFWPYSIEQHENILYVYSANENTSFDSLNTMLKNGLWFASYLDSLKETK
ncbi:MAG: hypothetical protein WCK26_02240 [Candidatus Saccharibacteria bacterium]